MTAILTLIGTRDVLVTMLKFAQIKAHTYSRFAE